jgi:hypothetical protein
LSMRSILHPVEHINQAHVSPPLNEKLFLTLYHAMTRTWRTFLPVTRSREFDL